MHIARGRPLAHSTTRSRTPLPFPLQLPIASSPSRSDSRFATAARHSGAGEKLAPAAFRQHRRRRPRDFAIITTSDAIATANTCLSTSSLSPPEKPRATAHPADRFARLSSHAAPPALGGSRRLRGAPGSRAPPRVGSDITHFICRTDSTSPSSSPPLPSAAPPPPAAAAAHSHTQTASKRRTSHARTHPTDRSATVLLPTEQSSPPPPPPPTRARMSHNDFL
jgi:hypothetical protein